MIITPISFPSGTNTLQGNIFSQDPTTQATVIILHGAGKSDKSRTDLLRTKLVAHGITSFAFDYSGHGESSGDIKDSSLSQRLNEASDAIRLVNPDRKPLTVLAFSMSGHIALRLTERFPVDRLFLFCPAVYARQAFDLPFGDGFSEVIRQEGSRADSDGIDALRQYRGELTVYIGDEDTVIPEGVIRMIQDNAIGVRSFGLQTIPGCGHHINAWLVEHEEWMERVVRSVVC